MELPRNITQVGETDRNCKIYVEDYVVSYMRQMNKFAEEKEITVALFGKMSVEQQITYCFVYGACMVQSISREVRHLSQAQNQEIERMRKKYFPEQDFLGYQILNGELIEGFRIYDQNSCRYVKGYACFFEKNDTMLAYMLEARLEEAKPESVEQDKYDMVKKRQEERRLQFEGKQKSEERRAAETEKVPQFKYAPFILGAVSCLALLMILGNDKVQENMKGQLTAWISDITEPKLDSYTQAENNTAPVIIVSEEVSQEVQSVMSTLVTEDKLADAILEENENAAESEADIESTSAAESMQQIGSAESEEMTEHVSVTEIIDETGLQSEEANEFQSEERDEPQNNPEENQNAEQQIEKYTIQPGDTLIAISTRIYGDDTAVSQICALNNISNPDNIQIGQKILLP